jgi:excisionase family DNA binding protein
MSQYKLIGMKAVQEILGGISRSSIYRLTDKGKLKPIKIGNRTLYAIDDVEAFVESVRV